MEGQICLECCLVIVFTSGVRFVNRTPVYFNSLQIMCHLLERFEVLVLLSLPVDSIQGARKWSNAIRQMPYYGAQMTIWWGVIFFYHSNI